MDVKNIIDLMAQTSIGIDQPTDMSRRIYLNYVNLYHFELYNKVAKLNPFIKIKKIYDVEVKSNILLYKPDVPFKANMLLQLNKINCTKDIGETDGEELPYRLEDNNIIIAKPIQFFNDRNNTVLVDYIPNPTPFTENTKEGAIPYPISYQQVLVYGANYHMYQNEGGMRSTSQFQFNMAKCKELESSLLAYLYDLSKTNTKEVRKYCEYRGY